MDPEVTTRTHSPETPPSAPAPVPARRGSRGRGAARPRPLRGLSDIRRFFFRNDAPIYFISATNFNLLGIDEWVRNFKYISYIDCFDGQHPNLFCPPEIGHEAFQSIEDINNYLLRHPEVRAVLKARGGGGRAVFLMFDEETEALAASNGLRVCFPPARLRKMVDNKVEATRIGNRAGVRSVPNVLARVDSWASLRKAARRLGDDLVVQTAFGDSGHTTFFISDEKDWEKHAEEISAEPEVKIMRRIRCRGSAIEGCVTRHGTIVGPLMTELVGFPELTPYKGGWCGNEVYADAFTRTIRRRARDATFKFGEELRKLGYRGYFELDFLTDLDSGKVWLGEVNPRITGASSMTNLASFAHADAPLFLFHLLEYMDVDYELDVEELNARWSEPENIDSWAQLVIKYTDEEIRTVTAAPPSGIWEMDDAGGIGYVRMQTHRRTVRTPGRAFFLRIARTGDHLYKGADLGILVTPGRLMDDDFRLTERARHWIRGIHDHYRSEPVVKRSSPIRVVMPKVGRFKLL